jgi:hypothetical protein
VRIRLNARSAANAAVLAAIFLVAPPSARALAPQGGYTMEAHPDLGLSFERARDYEQIPTQPDEQFVVLQFGEKLPEKASAKKTLRPEMWLVWIDYVSDPAAPRTREPSPDGGADAGGTTAGEPRATNEPPPKPPINSLERWLDRGALSHWKLDKPVEGKPRDGYSTCEYTLVPGKDLRAVASGWIYAWRSPKRTVAIVGLCGIEEIKEQTKIWRYSAQHLKITEPAELSTESLERHYARTNWLDPEFRIGVRKKLVRGWKAEDTEHFIVIYDTLDQPLMRKVLRDVELLHAEYTKLFPPTAPVNAVSTVRVCKNRDEYIMYGGPPASAGYWNDQTEELVLYDAEKVNRQHQRSEADTFIVLYHEAFHQFIHYSAGELPPHPWFNEGHGDFFSGAVVRDGKVRSIGVNPWRVKLIKEVVLAGKYVPWQEIVHYDRAKYYANPAVCYSQGWSMVYFLRTSKEVAKRPEWAGILARYFDALKASWAAELKKLEAQGKQDDKKLRAKAEALACEQADAAAFANVDLDELENAWLAFVAKLDDGERK